MKAIVLFIVTPWSLVVIGGLAGARWLVKWFFSHWHDHEVAKSIASRYGRDA
jgi:hypothetical protein